MKMPELTHDEFGALRESIQRDGVRYPVLLDPHGAVIDGHHRQKACADLGVDCPTKTLDVDDETADRLRVSLNLARRQLTTLDQMEMIAWLAEQYAPAAAAAALARKADGGRGGLGEDSLGASLSSRKASEDIAEKIRADAAAVGRNVKVSRATVDRARRVARLSPETKAGIRAGKISVTAAIGESHPKKPKVKATRAELRRADDLGESARISANYAKGQYQSMLNAPAESINLPLIRRAEKIQELLTELIGLDPGKAVTQLPIERCRQFTVAHAQWWSDFTALCEARRARETPDLPPRPYRPVHATLNPVVLGHAEIPMEERHLPPGERAVLDWLRAQSEPATAKAVCVGIRNRSEGSVQLRLRVLLASGLVEVAGKAGKESAYRAVRRMTDDA